MPKDAPKIERRKITDLRPDPSNANQGTERGLRILDNSLSEGGLGRSVLADKNGILIAGNKTQERAVDNGYEEALVVHTTGKQLVVVQRDDLDLLDDNPNNPARRMAYYDNVASQHMAWDAAQIAADVEAGVDLSAMFMPMELDDILAGLDTGEPIPDPGAQIDRAGELQEKWQVKTGDLWIIPSKSGKGEHRLLCGDSTKTEDVARVMGGEKADAIITDPPYGVDKADWDSNVFPILTNTANLWNNYLKTQGICFWFCATRYVPETLQATSAIPYKWMFIWYPSNNMAHGDLGFQKFTAALVLSHSKAWRENMQDLKEIPIIVQEKLGHPTPKPLPLMSYIIEYAAKGDLVTDPFGGSGTTMVACEQLSRQCRMIEIAEPYCAVILERLANMGLEPRLEAVNATS